VKLALDENLPPALAHAINALLAPSGGQAISIPERCGRGVSDREWIEALQAEGGWAVLTFDRKLRTRPHERLALDSRASWYSSWLTGGIKRATGPWPRGSSAGCRI